MAGRRKKLRKAFGIDLVEGVVDRVLDPGKKGRKEQRRAREAAMAEAQSLYGQMPDASDLTPSVEFEGASDAYMLPESEMAGVEADPLAVAAQREALRQLQGIGRSGGYTQAEQAMRAAMARDVGRESAAREQAIIQNAYARGLGGGGAEIMGRMQASQSGANRLADLDAQMRMEGERRALQAMQAAGQMGGQMRDQSFGEGAARASAVDEWNRNNTEYRRGVQGRNVDRRNTQYAQAADAQQQAYGNRERAAGMAAGQYGQQAADARERSAQAINQQNQLIGMAVSSGSGGGGR